MFRSFYVLTVNVKKYNKLTCMTSKLYSLRTNFKKYAILKLPIMFKDIPINISPVNHAKISSTKNKSKSEEN
jgi:hypothetical protein